MLRTSQERSQPIRQYSQYHTNISTESKDPDGKSTEHAYNRAETDSDASASSDDSSRSVNGTELSSQSDQDQSKGRYY